ncbi:hypothetical protein ACIB24_22485 [Spongisporangium articulatum]|uniref:Uncharacterized protein n=1 Tax=Spongisporangium articulatum TaxID=3362603 RepID=A0ABW8AUT2_9ACTN
MALATVSRRRPPGQVAGISVAYQGAWPDTGLVAVSMDLLASERDRLTVWADKATELVWRSTISPLRTITLFISWGMAGEPQIQGQQTVTPLDGDTGRTALQAKYGARPVADDA